MQQRQEEAVWGESRAEADGCAHAPGVELESLGGAGFAFGGALEVGGAAALSGTITTVEKAGDSLSSFFR